jgi:hypothetical protein
LRFRADKILILLVVALAPLRNVKIAGVEPLNYFRVGAFPSAGAIVGHRRMAIIPPRRLVPLARGWRLLVLLVTTIALWLDFVALTLTPVWMAARSSSHGRVVLLAGCQFFVISSERASRSRIPT